MADPEVQTPGIAVVEDLTGDDVKMVGAEITQARAQRHGGLSPALHNDSAPIRSI